MEKFLPNTPFHVEFEIVSVCNLNCIYCYAQPFSNKIPPIGDLSRLFSKTKSEANPFEVLLAGGEPFMRKDIIDVIELAENTFKNIITVSTNGTLLPKLSEDDLERLRRLTGKGVTVQVSIDSIKPEINDKVRGKTSATLNGLDVLEKNNIPFTINTVVTAYNAADVLESVRYLMTKYTRMRLLSLQPLYPTVKTAKDNTYSNLSFSQEKLYDLSLATEKLKSEIGRKSIEVVQNTDKLKGRSGTALLETYELETCTAGLAQAGVFVNGDVTPCLNLRNVILGNVYNESWKTIWARALQRYCSLGINIEQCRLINCPLVKV